MLNATASVSPVVSDVPSFELSVARRCQAPLLDCVPKKNQALGEEMTVLWLSGDLRRCLEACGWSL